MNKTLLVCCLLGLAAALPVLADDYDVVILNGRVMDPETGFDGIRNVGVRDGRIVMITEESISGHESIDASSHVVAPGFIDTEMTRELGEDVREGLSERIPLGRLGTVADVAHAVRFLASDDAAYITGQVIHVNGGLD